MNIGIVTFHFAYNYGAVLQTWALQKYLSEKENNVEIINYCPPYHTERYAVRRSLLVSAKAIKQRGGSMLSICKGLLGTALENITKRKYRIKRAKAFNQFINTNFQLTEKYESIDEIQKAGIDKKILIAGSDQIWNRNITDYAFDDVYFLQFGDKLTKRIIYAASLGETTPDMCAEYLPRLIYPLDKISCREHKDSEQLQQIVHSNIQTMPDPTLLLNACDYESIETPIADEGKFVLLYLLKENRLANKYVSRLVAEGNKVIDISPKAVGIKGVIWRDNVAPGQFLSYIKKSSFVITNSFHGTVFSIIYKRGFACYTHGTRNERLTNLLSALNLSDRIVLEENNDQKLMQNTIDYESVMQRLKEQTDRVTEFFNLTE